MQLFACLFFIPLDSEIGTYERSNKQQFYNMCMVLVIFMNWMSISHENAWFLWPFIGIAVTYSAQ